MKRIRLFLLLSLLTLSMTAFADTFTDAQGRTWNFSGGSPSTAQLTGFSGTDLVIPKTVTYNGVNSDFVSISSSFRAPTTLKTLTLQNGVRGYRNTYADFIIPAKAFMSCSSLTTIDFGKASVDIEAEAFSSCTSLTTLTNTNNIQRFGTKSFYNCYNLEDAGNTDACWWVGNYAFANCRKLSGWNMPFWAEVKDGQDGFFGEGAFMNTNLGIIYIPVKSSSIPKKLCYGCPNLETIFWCIRSNTTNGSYEDSSVGTDVVYTPALSSIGDSAFMNCSSLKYLRTSRQSRYANGTSVLAVYDQAWNTLKYFPNLTTFGKSAFENCTNFYKNLYLYFSSSNKAIYKNAFANTGLKQVYFDTAPNLELIDAGAFKNCSNLTTVKFATNNKLATIGESAFYNDQNLYSMEFPTGSALTTIGKDAFYNCVGLKTNFKSLVNTKLTTVGEGAFDGCTNITYVDFPSTIQSVGGSDNRFRGRTFRNCLSLKGINIGTTGSNNYYTAGYGNPLISKDGKVFICYPAKHTEHTGYNNPNLSADFIDGYLVPSTVTTISDYAFQGCQDLHIVLPKAVTRIGSYAFDQCTQMTEITIPENVTDFGSSIFAGCTSLNSIYFLPTTPSATINGYTFGVTKANVTAYIKTSQYVNTNDVTKMTALQQALYPYFTKVTNLIPYKPSQKYQSRCFDFDVNFDGSSVKAYAVTGYNSSTNNIELTQIKYAPSRKSGGNTSSSYTGVIIEGTVNTNYTFKIGEETKTVSTNYLQGCPGTHWIYGNSGYTSTPTVYYGLNGNKFKQYSKAGRIPYNRAYLAASFNGLQLPSQQAEFQMVFFDEDGNDVTAIEQLEAGVTEEKDNGAYYNLNGVKVENPKKGIYIHNGKKIVIK